MMVGAQWSRPSILVSKGISSLFKNKTTYLYEKIKNIILNVLKLII